MVVTILKLGLFAAGWLAGLAAIRAAERAGAFRESRSRLLLHAALAVVISLFWFSELEWMVRHPAEVGRTLGWLALTAVPVGGFVLFLRWAHRRARARDAE